MSTKKLTQDTFINRCKEMHGDKFDYSKSIYVNSGTKIEIKCNTCNHEWFVSPANHIGPQKSGCPMCKKIAHQKRMNLTILSTEEFSSRANKIHNNKFDYSKSKYVGSNVKIKIICPTHGEFEQWPQDHMRGIGCASCNGVKKKTSEEFIAQAKEIFPHFDYSLVNYLNAHAAVEIICPRHGIFLQKPNAILNKIGCEKCGTERMLQTKIRNGTIIDPANLSAYQLYRRKIWRITNQQYKLHKDKINPENLPRSLKYHLDHKYPIQQGWINGKTAEEIGDWTNLQILEGMGNRRKSNKII